MASASPAKQARDFAMEMKHSLDMTREVSKILSAFLGKLLRHKTQFRLGLSLLSVIW